MKPALGQVEFVALMALLMALTAMNIDAILPGLADIRDDLGVTDANAVQLVVTIFVLGMVFGELVLGPMADAYGRKIIIQAGLVIYGLGTLLAVTAHSLEIVLLGRLIQGIGVSGPKVASRALIRDMYSGDSMARVMSLVMSVMILTPMIAPLIGQGILLAGNWRWVFGIFLAHGVIAALWLGLRQPETLEPAKRIPIDLGVLGRNGVAILRNARVMAATVAAGLMFGSLLCYVSLSQQIFVGLYDTGVWFPVWFGLLALPASVSALLNARLVMRYGMQRMTMLGFCGVTVTSIGLLLATLVSGGVPPFGLFFVLCFLNAFCFGSVFGNINAIAMQWLGRVAGLGAAMIASLSSLVAVAVSIPMGQLYDGSVLPVALAYLLAGVGGLGLIWAAERTRAVNV